MTAHTIRIIAVCYFIAATLAYTIGWLIVWVTRDRIKGIKIRVTLRLITEMALYFLAAYITFHGL